MEVLHCRNLFTFVKCHVFSVYLICKPYHSHFTSHICTDFGNMLGVEDFMTSWPETAEVENRGSHRGTRCLFWGVRGDRALKILEWANAKIMRNKKCWCQTINPENLESGFLEEGPQERQLLLALLQAPNANCPSLCTPREHYQFWKGDTPRDWGGGVILWSLSSIHHASWRLTHPGAGTDQAGSALTLILSLHHSGFCSLGLCLPLLSWCAWVSWSQSGERFAY